MATRARIAPPGSTPSRVAKRVRGCELYSRIDTWVGTRTGGRALRRDSNHDGIPDAWSYYDRAGELSRQEQD
jgi:hypothetical protein